MNSLMPLIGGMFLISNISMFLSRLSMGGKKKIILGVKPYSCENHILDQTDF